MAEQAKDTPHLGGSGIVRFGTTQWTKKTTEQLCLGLLKTAFALDFPLAQLLQLGEGVVSQHAQSWLVQPVNMQLQRDTFSLAPVPPLEIQDYETLSKLFNDYFKQDNIVFLPSASKQYWFLSLAQPIKASTHLVQTGLQQDAQHFQPDGDDASILRRIMNEAQMLLHEHPINQQRVAEHLPEINSLWISGGGALIKQTSQQSVAIGGHGTFVKGMSAWLDQPILPDLQTVLQSRVEEAVLFYEHNAQLDWAYLFQQVKRGNIKQLQLYLPDAHLTRHTVLNTLDCWKFWRKPYALMPNKQMLNEAH